MRTIRIDFNVDDTHASIKALLDRIFGPYTSGQLVANDVLLDLKDCKFIGPSAVVTLSGLRRMAEHHGRTWELRSPELPRLANYCRYAGLLSAFGLPATPDLGHPSNVTTPVRSFTSSEMLMGIIEQVVNLARREMTLSSASEGHLTQALSELTQNVLDHSQSPVGGFVSARAYENEHEVRFAVADMGIGIRKSLSGRMELTSDSQAIQQAIQEAVTSRSLRRNMGLGLAHLHAIVKRRLGRMVIYSQAGYLKHESGGDKFNSTDTCYPGTLAFVKLPMAQAMAQEKPQAKAIDVWDI